MSDTVQTVSVPLSESERQEHLQLVDTIQAERSSVLLRPEMIPHILLPYQAAWHADKSQIRVGQKSRRIGFSWGSEAAEAALMAAASKSSGGMNQFYMGYNQAMSAEFIGDTVFFAKAYQLSVSAIDVGKHTEIIHNERKDIVTYKIKFASGFKVEALSSCPYNWRSRQGHARIDEAAFHADLKEVIKGALAFLMWGGRLDIVSTHDGEDNYFNQLVRDIKAGKLPKYSLHTITFDDALRAGFYKRVCLVRNMPYSQEAEAQYREDTYNGYPSREDADEELGCIPKRGTGAFFTRMLLEKCHCDNIPTVKWSQPAAFVTDPERIQKALEWIRENLQPVLDALPTNRRSVYGQDFGRNNDLSIIWVLQEYSQHWKQAFSVELRNIPFDVQKLITLYILDALPLLHHAKFDARGNGQSHAEAALQKYGESKVDCVMFTAAWYAEWFPKYHQAYEGENIQISATEDVIADHRMVQLSNGKPSISGSRVKGSDGQYRHGDSAVAGVLAWSATSKESGYGPPAATSTGQGVAARLTAGY